MVREKSYRSIYIDYKDNNNIIVRNIERGSESVFLLQLLLLFQLRSLNKSEHKNVQQENNFISKNGKDSNPIFCNNSSTITLQGSNLR